MERGFPLLGRLAILRVVFVLSCLLWAVNRCMGPFVFYALAVGLLTFAEKLLRCLTTTSAPTQALLSTNCGQKRCAVLIPNMPASNTTVGRKRGAVFDPPSTPNMPASNTLAGGCTIGNGYV